MVSSILATAVVYRQLCPSQRLTVVNECVCVDSASVWRRNFPTLSLWTVAPYELLEMNDLLGAAGWSDPLYFLSLSGASHTVYLCTHHSIIS